MFFSVILVTNYNREQSELILKSLIDTNININISIFYEKQDSYKTIRNLTYHIGNVGVDLKGKNQNRQDIDIAAFTYNDAKYIRKEMQVNNEDLYFLYIYVNTFSTDEKELEDALVNQITQFLLELGTGFSYMGRQVHIRVGESDFYMDLLFYHARLHCYVVVELKTEKFKPEFAGKLNFYVTAVNKQIKTLQDNPTIGILICKDKDDVVAEYALDDISQPIGIAEYELTKVLREEFKSSLPTVEEIENELSE